MNNHLFILVEIILDLNELIDKELNSRVNLKDCRKQDHYFKTMSDQTDIKHIEYMIGDNSNRNSIKS